MTEIQCLNYYPFHQNKHCSFKIKYCKRRTLYSSSWPLLLPQISVLLTRWEICLRRIQKVKNKPHMVVLILPYRNVGTFIKRTFFEQKILFQVKSKKRMDNKMKKNSYMNNQKNHANPSMGILVQLGTSTCKSAQQPSKRSNSVYLVLFSIFPIQEGSIWATVQP